MPPIPLYVFTGYLGSGKTTLLNHLLGQPRLADRRVALLINEFGSLGVDGQVVDSSQHDLFELNSGSLFCACTRSGLVDILGRIAADVRPDLVLAEATGVAETSDLYDVLCQPPLAGRFAIAANACLVDSVNFTKVVAFLRAARSQVAMADGLVLNKTDQADARTLENLGRLLAELNPRAPQAQVRFGQLAWEFLEGLRHHPPSESPPLAPPTDIVTCSISSSRANREALAGVVESLGSRLLRLKGVVDFGDGPRLVESVFGSFSQHALETKSPRPGTTAIGWRISRQELFTIVSSAFPDEPKTFVTIDGP